MVNVLVPNTSCVFVAGAAPAPPPRTTPPDARSAEDAHVDVLLKYGIPPEVPATVSAGVVVAVATEIKPPVKDTEVTVPVPAGKSAATNARNVGVAAPPDTGPANTVFAVWVSKLNANVPAVVIGEPETENSTPGTVRATLVTVPVVGVVHVIDVEPPACEVKT
jgi:hypothetical protein